jgi:hypothetical protein
MILFNPAELYAILGSDNVRLDKDFVQNTLDTYGPIFRSRDIGDWSFDEHPTYVPPVASIETEFYGWYLWLVASPVAHASNAVCDALNLRGANIDIYSVMRADEVRKTMGGGATDIVQRWFQWRNDVPWTKTCILHEFKRDNVLRVDDQCTLGHLVALASTTDGYHFRAAGATAKYSSHEGKNFNLVCQASIQLQAATGR